MTQILNTSFSTTGMNTARKSTNNVSNAFDNNFNIQSLQNFKTARGNNINSNRQKRTRKQPRQLNIQFQSLLIPRLSAKAKLYTNTIPQPYHKTSRLCKCMHTERPSNW
jgi:hypothetical protein